MRYYLYCRKSQESEDRQILSLDAQERELKAFAKKKEITIVKTFRESYSAFKIGRPLFNEMIEGFENGEADGLLVWQVNRIARNSMDGGKVIYLMDQERIKEICTPHRSFNNFANDKFFINLEFGVAKKSSDDNSESVRRGNREKFHERHGWAGVAPSGYLNTKDIATGGNIIISDPDRFPLIQRSIKAVIYGGLTPIEAMNQLNNDWGYRSLKRRKTGGLPMSRSTFYKILSNPFYYGWMVRKEGETWGNHEPMITEEEFNRLQIILGSNGRAPREEYNWPYKTALQCGECGASITCEQKIQIICSKCKTKFHKGRNTDSCTNCGTKIEEMRSPTLLRYVYYHCTKKVDPNCSQGSVEIHKLEAQIDAVLSQIEISPAMRTWLIRLLRSNNEKEIPTQDTIKQNLEREHNKLQSELQNLLKLKISVENVDEELLSNEEFKQEKVRLQGLKQDSEEKLSSFNHNFDNHIDRMSRMIDFAESAPKEFLDAGRERKTEILAQLGSNLTIKEKKLVLGSENPYLLIIKDKVLQQYDLSTLEPEKYFVGKRKVKLIEEFIPAWLGD